MVEGKEAELGLNGVIEVFSDIEEGTEVNKVKDILTVLTHTPIQKSNVVANKSHAKCMRHKTFRNIHILVLKYHSVYSGAFLSINDSS